MSAVNDPIRVLLAEDSPDDVFFFQRALQKCSLPTALRVAEDGAKAIHLLNETANPRPQLMFLDLKMPNVNGFEVLEWLAQQPFKAAIRVVVLTSSEEPREMQLARSLGAAEFITKPVTPDKLRAQILLAAPQSVTNTP